MRQDKGSLGGVSIAPTRPPGETPVALRITADILTTLGTISTENGYWYNVVVEREKRRGNNPPAPGQFKLVLHQLDPTEITDEVTLKAGWLQPYMIDILIALPEGDDTPPDLILNRLCADIAKALMIDRHRSQLVVDTYIRPWSAFVLLQGDLEGREFHFDCQFRTADKPCKCGERKQALNEAVPDVGKATTGILGGT